MNILLGILKYPPDYAGDGLRFHRMFKRLKSNSSIRDVYVLTSWNRPAAEEETRDGIKIIRKVECTLKPSFRRLSKKFSLIHQTFKLIFCYADLSSKIDLVFTSGSGWFPSLIAWLGFLTQKPVVKEIVLLGSDDPRTLVREKGFWCRWFFLLPFKFSKLIITISPALEAACLDLKISGDKIWCRFNPVNFGVDTAELIQSKENQLKTKSSLPVLLWVGAITRRKNVAFLLQAACHLDFPAKVWFVGPSDDKEYFKEVLEVRKKVPSHVEVKFFGQIDNQEELARLYSQADLFWFASKNEGMGNVVAEALVCGTPVVTLPVMGIMKQVIPSSEDGEIVDTQDPKEFARAACRWIKRKVDRAALSNRARERFNIEAVDTQYITRFEKLAGFQMNLRHERLSEKLQKSPAELEKPAAIPGGV